MTRFRRAALRAVLAFLATAPWAATPELAHAIGGIEGTFEYAIDAPWRMEPTLLAGGGLAYGAIPIQISIHDAHDVGRDRQGISNASAIALGRVCKVVVRERAATDAPGAPPSGPTTTVPFSGLDEVEYTQGRWPAPGDADQAAPAHGLCRAWAGQDCTGFDRVSGSSEWHASFDYRPSQVNPGTTVSLQVEVHLTKNPLSNCATVPASGRLKLVNELSVYHAPAPLPRFGPEWAYGDLHYHSQGTDNEGESAYNYRGVVRAMGALGIDFAFATEHASNSRQIIDVDAKADLSGIEFPPAETRLGLRDMSPARFGFLHGLLNGAGGANSQAALLTGLGGGPAATPQIFLGGEVDLIPELAPGTQYGDVLPWGNGQEWSTENLCVGPLRLGPLQITCATFGVNLLQQTATEPDAVLVDDVQGFSVDFGRHHIVYLPRSAADNGAFVRSDTGSYGGAGRRFVALRPELEQHGYFFAAHSFSHYEGGADLTPDVGPTDIPWSDHMYDQVWRSPAWLGLQFWNEDARLREPVPAWGAFTTTSPFPSSEYCVGLFVYRCPKAGGDVGYERYDSPVPGIPFATLPVDRPQAGFGSGLFHLKLDPPVSGRWRQSLDDVEEKLHHGAFTWDRLNHWGLDVRKTQGLDWLPSFLAPRRLFMAGGSDAHGDLNYRRTGYLIRTDAVNDTALGKPRNLVEAGASADSRTQTQVADALADGRFSVTDGPGLRIAVDRNADGLINGGDARMGDVVALGAPGGHTLPLLVEWRSTPEFGAVQRIDLYVGARSSRDDLAGQAEDIGRTYAPPGAGVYHSSIPGIGLPDPGVDDPPYNRMNDNYWEDPTGLLSFTPSDGFSGIRVLLLDLARFPALRNLPADRFFVRAFAITNTADPGACVADHESCLPRYAFTNPIWAIDNTYVCSAEAALDQGSPAVSCNAPATTPADGTASFTATAADACPAGVEVGEVECDGPGTVCPVTTNGATTTVASGASVGTVIRWTATATDAAGNRAVASCRTEVR